MFHGEGHGPSAQCKQAPSETRPDARAPEVPSRLSPPREALSPSGEPDPKSRTPTPSDAQDAPRDDASSTIASSGAASSSRVKRAVSVPSMRTDTGLRGASLSSCQFETSTDGQSTHGESSDSPPSRYSSPSRSSKSVSFSLGKGPGAGAVATHGETRRNGAHDPCTGTRMAPYSSSSALKKMVSFSSTEPSIQGPRSKPLLFVETEFADYEHSDGTSSSGAASPAVPTKAMAFRTGSRKRRAGAGGARAGPSTRLEEAFVTAPSSEAWAALKSAVSGSPTPIFSDILETESIEGEGSDCATSIASSGPAKRPGSFPVHMGRAGARDDPQPTTYGGLRPLGVPMGPADVGTLDTHVLDATQYDSDGASSSRSSLAPPIRRVVSFSFRKGFRSRREPSTDAESQCVGPLKGRMFTNDALCWDAKLFSPLSNAPSASFEDKYPALELETPSNTRRNLLRSHSAPFSPKGKAKGKHVHKAPSRHNPLSELDAAFGSLRSFGSMRFGSMRRRGQRFSSSAFVARRHSMLPGAGREGDADPAWLPRPAAQQNRLRTLLVRSVALLCLAFLVLVTWTVQWAAQGAAAPARVEVRGRRLYVDGEAYFVRGVNYNPIPKGEDGRRPPYGDYFGKGYAIRGWGAAFDARLYTPSGFWQGLANKFAGHRSFHEVLFGGGGCPWGGGKGDQGTRAAHPGPVFPL